MNTSGWIQLACFVAILAIITRPMGAYLMQVLDPRGHTWLDPVIAPVERWTYRRMGITADREQNWKEYTVSLLGFSLMGTAFTFILLRAQSFLPLNPQGMGSLSPDLAFNTAASFASNTDWQSYSGETTMSYLSQMVALTWHNFTSAATGIAVAAALVRGIVRVAPGGLGCFWVDVIRITYYLLVPLSLLLAIFLVSQGTIQNFSAYTHATRLEAAQRATIGTEGVPGVESVTEQLIAQGPVASQVAIKMLGTNGGGFFNANAAHPFENPTPLTNFVQLLAVFSIGSGLTHYLGRMTRRPSHGWSIWTAMLLLFLAGVVACWWAEAQGNPLHHQLGIALGDGNLEGKEVRFGIFSSALFATVTTDASCGAVNSMHDSFTALGGLVPLFNIQLGEVIFGGVGAGLYGMLVFVVLSVFIAGLMVGRTPEYLGKKIQAFEVKMAMLSQLVVCLSILGFASAAAVSEWGVAGLNNLGPHGLTEILYAFTSAAGNNGSAFAGLTTNTPWYNVTLGLTMLIGRFLMIAPIMALAGSLARKPVAAESAGTFPVAGGTFILLLIATILLLGALNFLPVLALGPILEHFLTQQGQLF